MSGIKKCYEAIVCEKEDGVEAIQLLLKETHYY